MISLLKIFFVSDPVLVSRGSKILCGRCANHKMFDNVWQCLTMFDNVFYKCFLQMFFTYVFYKCLTMFDSCLKMHMFPFFRSDDNLICTCSHAIWRTVVQEDQRFWSITFFLKTLGRSPQNTCYILKKMTQRIPPNETPEGTAEKQKSGFQRRKNVYV